VLRRSQQTPSEPQEARALLDRGQTNRRVFSTLANRASSRSHSVFTIKVIKIRKGAGVDDLSAASTSRFSIVDLAGSERANNTQAFGELPLFIVVC
jgi:kinesin family protein 20